MLAVEFSGKVGIKITLSFFVLLEKKKGVSLISIAYIEMLAASKDKQ